MHSPARDYRYLLLCLLSVSISMPVQAFASTELAANELQGKICQASIQNQIEWDYKGSRRWARSNLEKMCRDAGDSLQPGVCFNRIMHGGVSHGKGTRWNWRPALQLCAGTLDANSTIACFTAAIDSGTAWRQAIEKCRE